MLERVSLSGQPRHNQHVLSPTLYWKVAQERGNKTSPCTTCSAAKRAEESAHRQERDLHAALDELQEESSSSDEEEEDECLDLTTLHFSPPDRRLRENLAKNA